MKKKYYLPVAILLAGGMVLFAAVRRSHPVATKVAFSDAAGLQIAGLPTADGKEQEIDETLPAEMTITTRRMFLLVESSDQTKNIRADILADGKRSISGAQRRIRVYVTGNTMFSSPRAYVKAY